MNNLVFWAHSYCRSTLKFYSELSKALSRNCFIYTWIENYDTAHLTSKKVNKFEIMDQVDDDRLAQLIPDFYVFPEKSVSYNILKQGKHAFILSIGNRAIMHCAR